MSTKKRDDRIKLAGIKIFPKIGASAEERFIAQKCEVDLTVEDEQDFIEDCSFCCRPNRIVISPIQEGEGLLVTAMLTDE